MVIFKYVKIKLKLEAKMPKEGGFSGATP